MHVESDGRTAGGDRSSSDATDAHTMHDMSSMPGMSGMSGGHDKHAGHSPEMFRRLFWWNLALSIPVVIFSKQFQEWFGYTIDGAWTEWVPPIFGTIIYFWGGQPFLKGARVELHDRQPGMMTLISLAITVAYGASIASSLGIGDMDFWWELAGLIVVMLLGHWQEMKAIGQAQGALQALAELLPDTAEKIVGDRIQTVPVSTLAVDDTVLVRPGGRAPADGTIVEGDASFDESMITGESRPIRRTTGDRVVGGTIARDSSVRIRVDAIGDDTALASIQRMVADAQTSDSRAQALADRAAGALFYVATGAALLTVIVWTALGKPADGITRGVSVLVIACPHALGLAIPLVISISTSIAAKAGILVKSRLALERMRTIDVVLFDKTGTLTEGKQTVSDFAAVEPAADGGQTTSTEQAARAGHAGDAHHRVGDISASAGATRGGEQTAADNMLLTAAAAETESEHPTARAIVTAGRHVGHVPTAHQFETMPGLGVKAVVDGRQVQVGGPNLLRKLNLHAPTSLAHTEADWNAQGGSVIWVIVDGHIIGGITLSDQVRPESADAVRELAADGVKVMMITGDSSEVARTVANRLGIDEVFAEVLPADKDAKVDALQQRGLKVAMVGDGVNDAPALARADVGIAIGAGTDVAIESADVVLASSDPRGVNSVIKLSKATYSKMIQNLIWATAYNVVAIPVAAGVFAFAGVTVPPAAAAIAMSLSTIIVAANAELLRRADLRP
ncbi:MAG: heavy metal translocating P-type ATPase [Actinobacteria bacterium]|nr:heavy metal translocating P-type ATPase [Actinomycetota bacterium]